MAKRMNAKTQLTISVEGSRVEMHLCIPLQTLLALIAIVTGSPALITGLTRLIAG